MWRKAVGFVILALSAQAFFYSTGIGEAVAQTVPTLFVDQAAPNCSDKGPGSASQPFCTIGAAAGKAVGGQTVVVSQGTYVEKVTVANSGTQAAPIVFTSAAGATVTVTAKTNGFVISNKSWITVHGFNVTGTTSDGLSVTNSSHITLSGNHVSYAGQPVSGKTAVGIRISGASDSLVLSNIVDHNSDFGIYLTTGTTRVTVAGNATSYNARVIVRAAAGIDVFGSNDNVIEFNISHHNEDSGIEFRSGASGNLAVSNVSYLNGDHGIDVTSSPSQRIISNSVYKNVTSGINVEGTSSPATLANNVSVDNGINSPRSVGNIRVDSTAISGATLDYDEVFLHSPSAMIVWGSTSYSSLSAFVAATGQESHGIQADPLWEAAETGDLRLIAGSPAIDSANSGVSDESDIDADGNPRIDDPATPNTGVGPRTYDDRGAYEFQPTAATPTPTATPNPPPTATPTPTATATPSPTPADTPSPAPTATPSPASTDTPSPAPTTTPSPVPTDTPSPGPTATTTPAPTATPSPAPTATPSPTATSVPDAPPIAALTVSPASGTAPLTVTADASGSSDTDATPISTYTFDFGDGTVVGPQPGPTAEHTYGAAGTYTVQVTVTDTAALATTATTTVAVQVNFVGNPGFETGTSGWNNGGSGAGITLARASDGHSGGFAAQLTNTGTTASTCSLNDSPNWVATTSAGTYTGTLWVRADVAGATLKLRIREYNGSTLVGSQSTLATLGTGWQLVTVAYVPVAPGSSTLDFNAYVSSAAAGTCFYADDASINVN